MSVFKGNPAQHTVFIDIKRYNAEGIDGIIVSNDPVNAVDPWGLAPGDIFNSLDDAAIDAIDYSMPAAERVDREYGGYLYKTDKGKYSYADPVQGERNGIHTDNFNCIPENSDKAGIYHTHQGNNRMAPFFSPFDDITSGLQGVPIYLGTNKGIVKKHTPGSGDTTIRY